MLLKQSQLRILNLIFKFRFITSQQLADIKHVRSSSLRRSLQTLRQDGYIDRHYDKLSVINREHAEYYLTKVGLKALVDAELRTTEEIHALYRDNYASRNFRAEYLIATETYIALKAVYGDTFTIYSQTELRGNDLFTEARPSYYLEGADRSYMLDILGGDNPFGFQRRLQAYLKHADSEEWQDQTGNDYPGILIVCKTRSQETLVKRSAKRMASKYDSDVQIYTTTQKALLTHPYESKVWTEITDPDALIAL